MEKYQQSNS